MALIDPALYGAEKQVLDVKFQPTPEAGSATPAPLQAVPFGELLPQERQQEGIAFQEALAQPESTMWEGVKSAFQLSDTGRILSSMNGDHWDAANTFGVKADPQAFSVFLAHADIPGLSEEERNFIAEGATPMAWARQVEKVKRLREARKITSDHEAINFLVTAADPVQWGLAAATGGGTAYVKYGRLAAMAANAAVPYAIDQMADAPKRTLKELIPEMMFSAAAAGLTYKGGKLVKEFPDMPNAEMQAAISKPKVKYIPATFEEEVIPAHTVFEEVSPAVYKDVEHPATWADVPVELDRTLKNAKPRYGYRDSNFGVTFASDVDKAAFIIAQKTKSKADSMYRQFIKDATGLDDAGVDALGAQVRAQIKDAAKAGHAVGNHEDLVLPAVYTGEVKKVSRIVSEARTERVLVEKAKVAPRTIPEQRRMKQLTPARFEELPPALQGGAKATDAEVAAAVDARLAEGTEKRGWLSNFYWNVHNSLAKHNKEVADIMVDNNSDLSKTSLESIKLSTWADLHQAEEMALSDVVSTLKERGHGIVSALVTPRKYAQAQRDLMREVKREMERQTEAHFKNLPITSDGVDPAVWKIVSKYNEATKRALKEAKAAGVPGAELVEFHPGYYPRRWSMYGVDRAMKAFAAAGRDGEAEVKKMVTASLMKANGGMDEFAAKNISAALIDRVIRRGEAGDATFLLNGSAGQMALIRDVLQSRVEQGALPYKDMERIMDSLRTTRAEQGKAAFMKHRVELDYTHGVDVGGQKITVSDLLDDRVETSLNQYFEGMAGRIALARKGVTVDELRSQFMSKVGFQDANEAARLFDNTMARILGNPVGDPMNQGMRLISAYTRAIALGKAGIWQVAESATIAGRYGLGNTIKHAIKEFPPFRALMNPTKEEARSLKNVLAFHAQQHMRIKPMMYRFEDNFDVPMDSAVQMQAQAVGQLVPYVNGMKYVHDMQANMTAGLIVDRIVQAAEGNAKARAALAKYGLRSQVMDKISANIRAHGMNVDTWDDAVWAEARPAFGKMMDEAVMHQRLGDTPAFMEFDNVGKFVLTFRGFTLAAHNKLFVGGVERNGLGATGLMLLYQVPLATLAVQAANVADGKPALTQGKLIQEVGAQLSVLGGLTEAYKIAGGSETSMGNPALIAADRAIKFAGKTAQGDLQGAAATGMSLIPLYNAVPFAKATNNLITGQ